MIGFFKKVCCVAVISFLGAQAGLAMDHNSDGVGDENVSGHTYRLQEKSRDCMINIDTGKEASASTVTQLSSVEEGFNNKSYLWISSDNSSGGSCQVSAAQTETKETFETLNSAERLERKCGGSCQIKKDASEEKPINMSFGKKT